MCTRRGEAEGLQTTKAFPLSLSVVAEGPPMLTAKSGALPASLPPSFSPPLLSFSFFVDDAAKAAPHSFRESAGDACLRSCCLPVAVLNLRLQQQQVQQQLQHQQRRQPQEQQKQQHQQQQKQQKQQQQQARQETVVSLSSVESAC
ncbi:hypothetical protein Esti_001003 [Eimeria stiedai]